jgi:hypothetical protein
MVWKTNVKEKKDLPVQLAAWKPTRAGLPLPFLAVGPPEPLPPLLFHRSCYRFLSLFANGWSPHVSRVFYPTRDQAGVEHSVLRFNPEFYGIFLEAKVPWGYLSKPHAFAHLFYEDFGVVCPSLRPPAW